MSSKKRKAPDGEAPKVAKPAKEAVSDEPAAFPRGGGSVLTPLEHRKLALQVKADIEREDVLSGGKGRKRAKKGADNDDEESFFKAQSSAGRVPKFVELLRFSNIAVGAKVWGVIMEVTSKRLAVSLPHGLRGFVAPEEASDVLRALLAPADKRDRALLKAANGAVPSLPDLFYVGQFVQCCVLEVAEGAAAAAGDGKKKGKAGVGEGGKGKKIHLTLRLAEVCKGRDKTAFPAGAVVPAVIRTVEDHGYALGFGVPGVGGFLSAADFVAAFGPEAVARPGLLLQTVVKDCGRDGCSLVVDCNAAAIAPQVTEQFHGVTMSSLLPGQLVTATVRTVLSDGLLVSFLKFFHGTIDQFHMPLDALGRDARSPFSANQRLKARILYVDSEAKVVRLSLLKSLVGYHLPEGMPMLGDVFDEAKVLRADRALGLLLQVPTQPVPCMGYVHISNVQDDKTDTNLVKAFPPGAAVRARVIGFRPLDGLAILSMKESSMTQNLVTWATLQPGAIVDGSVQKLEDFGVIVRITAAICGVVPLLHVTEAAAPKNLRARFKVGQTLRCRVMDVDATARKVTLTLKRGIIDSKLPALLSMSDARAGVRAHGFVTGVTERGVFVEFFNRVKGLVAAAELALPPGQTATDAYSVGQVIKCTVIGADPKKGLRLSLRGKGAQPAALEPSAHERLGEFAVPSVVGGARVERVLLRDGDPEAPPEAFMLAVSTADGEHSAAARLEAAHLSDHLQAAQALAAALQVGSVLPEVVVLERREQAGLLVVSAKASLIAAAHAGALPSSLADLVPGALLPGYLASVTKDACFVRFANGLTGRAGLPQVSDTFVSDTTSSFAVGQSVTAQVASIDEAAARFSVSLKPSLTSRKDAAFLATYFRDMALAAELQRDGAAQGAGDGAPAIGSLIDVKVDEERDYGFVCDISGNDDLVGLITPAHLPPGKPPAPGAGLEAVVLDLQPLDGIVDLSLKQTLVEGGKKPKKQRKLLSQLAVGASVDVFVELVKEDAMYLVASVPSCGNALAFVATSDFNLQRSGATRAFQHGQKLSATVARLPEASGPLPGAPGGRLLLHVPLATAPPPAKAQKGRLKQGAVTSARVTAVHAMHADVLLGKRKGHLHITEYRDFAPEDADAQVGKSIFGDLKAGADLAVVVLGNAASAGAKQHRVLELSARASAVQAAQAGGSAAPATSWGDLSVGSRVQGAVQEVGDDHVYVALSPAVRGRVHILHASADVDALAAARKRFAVGSLVVASVLAVDASKQRLDLSLLADGSVASLCRGAPNPEAGTLLMGKVVAMSGRGVRVQVASGAIGSAPLTNLHDKFVPNALQGLGECPYVRCRVMESGQADKPGSMRLSLKPSDGGVHAGHAQPVDGPETPADGAALDLSRGDTVHGYVKSVQPAGSRGAGVFLWLSASLEARVKLNHLADHFIDDPVATFPEAKHVVGRVLAAAGGRVDLTLKSNQTASDRWQTLATLEVGQVVAGRVKRVEKFGVFVDIADSTLTGLAHISELADSFVKDPAARFQPGSAVRAVVLKKDEATGKVSLGMKPAYFADADAAADGAEDDADAPADRPRSAGRRVGDADGGDDDIDVDAAITAAFDESSDDEEEEEEEEEEDEDDAGAMEVDDEDDDGAEMQVDDAEGDRVVAGEDDDEEEEEEDDDDEDDDGSEGVGASGRGDGADGSAGDGDRLRSGRAASTSRGDAFGWDALMLAPDDAAPAEPQAEAADAKTSKRAKKRAREQHEAAVRQAEHARLEDSAPSSEDDFERLVLASPNSSFVWIRYMAFLLNLSEVQKARALAERALTTIDYREQNEKFNVWLAYLNLENTFADNPEEAASALLQRALQYNDAKKMYLAATTTFETTGREELAANCRKAMCRKFGGSCKVWLKAFEHAVAAGRDPKGVIDRATNSLPTRKHVKFVSRAALLELKRGSQDRGRAMFEGLLRAYPRRSDLWSVYIDQEIRLGDQTSIRNLFERAIHLQLPPKKMQFFFKRYVAYEAAHGTKESVAYVKKQAMAYIEGLQAGQT